MGGILSVLAPVLTVAVALLTKNVIIALFIGIFYSSILINGVNFLVPMADYILQGIQGNGFILVLFIPLGVMLRFMRLGGGFKAFEEWAHRKVESAEKAFAMASDSGTALFFYEHETRGLRETLEGQGVSDTVSHVVGPEGGISAGEAEGFAGAGAKSVTLGPRILRAETAAVAGCAVIMNLWGDL